MFAAAMNSRHIMLTSYIPLAASISKKMEATILKLGRTIVVRPVEIPTVGMLIKFADTEENVACAIQYFKKG